MGESSLARPLGAKIRDQAIPERSRPVHRPRGPERALVGAHGLGKGNGHAMLGSVNPGRPLATFAELAATPDEVRAKVLDGAIVIAPDSFPRPARSSAHGR